MTPPATDFPQLGRYQVIDRIATGGMAEVFLARSVGAMGFQRLVAVKLIHANFTRDQEFVKMFIDEARIAMHLSHRNIVQVFDLDKVNGTYFLAMEYVRGVNLYDLYERIASRHRWIEVPMALFLVAEICKGLHFAHTRSGPDGRPLGIVHRDISPQNVLLSFEGEVKITDFGIATAAERLHQTAAGIVKGKYAYMAPERLQEQGSDGRVDVFAAGVLLYEMLVGENPFAGGSAVATIEAVLDKEVPVPSERGAAVPWRLDEICAKALAKDPNDRWPTAQAFADALTELAMELTYARKDMASGDAAVAGLLAELFPEERSRRVGESRVHVSEDGPTRKSSRTGLEPTPVAQSSLTEDSIDDLDEPTLLRGVAFKDGEPDLGSGGTSPQPSVDNTIPTMIPSARPMLSEPTADVPNTYAEEEVDDPDAMTLPSGGTDATAQMGAVTYRSGPIDDASQETLLPGQASAPMTSRDGSMPVSHWAARPPIPDPAEHHPSREMTRPGAAQLHSGRRMALVLSGIAAVLVAIALGAAYIRQRQVQIVEVPLNIESTPSGARVTVDGELLSAPTPTSTRVLAERPVQVDL
ncbi:MAG: serine/threonine-protein kinase, partial [Myxococcota bacterium]